MYYVYILQSLKYPDIVYRGYTKDVFNRLAKHNKGDSVFTNKYRPWKLKCYFAFSDKSIAISFEKYLKSGSGKAFLKKRFINLPS